VVEFAISVSTERYGTQMLPASFGRRESTDNKISFRLKSLEIGAIILNYFRFSEALDLKITSRRNDQVLRFLAAAAAGMSLAP
jgi:hypothetical protein